jgi:hypothetical protein
MLISIFSLKSYLSENTVTLSIVTLTNIEYRRRLFWFVSTRVDFYRLSITVYCYRLLSIIVDPGVTDSRSCSPPSLLHKVAAERFVCPYYSRANPRLLSPVVIFIVRANQTVYCCLVTLCCIIICFMLKCFFSLSLYFTNKVPCPHYRDCFVAPFYRLVFIWLCCVVSYTRCCTLFVSFRPESVPNREHVYAQMFLRPRRVPYIEYITL